MAPLLAPRTDRSFERLYRRHVSDVYRYTLAVLRNPADAEDVTQTTFMNAYRAFSAGERPRQPHNWLIAIAHNVCRQRFRQAQRRVEEVAYDDSVAETFVDDDPAPTADDLKRALGHLAFNQRAALVMRELEGRSYAEIAEILELSVSAVETLIFRARRALREQLEGRLTCRDAELAISRQLDGRLPRSERGPLRAHLRECAECASLARKLRAQRTAIRALGLVPLPPSLGSFFGGAAAGGASASVGGGLAAKAAIGLAATAVAAGGGYEAVRHAVPGEAKATRAEEAVSVQAPASTTRRATPPPLALAPRERDSGAPYGKAVGFRRRAATSAAEREERAQGRAERPASANPKKSRPAKPARAKPERTRGRGRAAASVPKRPRPQARPPAHARPANPAPGRPAEPPGRAEAPPAPPVERSPEPGPPAKPEKREDPPAAATPVDVAPVVEEAVETATGPMEKVKK